ncbi:MAG: glycosyltransferase [Acidobacteriota bacterium]|nr:MAG: glycosyltransferase [Acidobacteriota bacterium]
MIYIYYFFAVVLIYLSYRSFEGGLKYRQFVLDELSKGSSFTPFATVFAPCRGAEPGLHKNLAALFELDYPQYEIVFVTDDAADPSVAIIEELIGNDGGSLSAKLIIAPKAEAASQKVENLREAVLHADPNSEVFSFVDSDVRPARHWLRYLVAPLSEDNVGASTGYRWFISKRRNFVSELRSAWNASIASALGPNRDSNFCWGGAMAIRRDVFERIGMRERWSGTLSDDFAVTRAMKSENLEIAYAPGALTPSFEDCSFSEMIEFTTRQMKITRVYGTTFWVMSFIGSALFTTVIAASMLVLILNRQNQTAVIISLASLVLVSFFSVGKSIVRLQAVEAAIPELATAIRRQYLPHCTLWALTPSIFFFNSISALFSRRLRWRGNVYELKSPNETVIISTKDGQ